MVDRRGFLKASAALGAVVALRPLRGIAGTPLRSSGAARSSLLFPANGLSLVHSDLHNHTVVSDGAGAGDRAFGMMRDAGLDVAALTDHAIMGKDAGEVCAQRQPCTIAFGISERTWREQGVYAERANEDHVFVALRGFEWSTGSLGHANVWFTDDWTDALRTGSLVDPKGIAGGFRAAPGPGNELANRYEDATRPLPDLAHMDGFYEWLFSNAGLAGFNHPNLYGDFEAFRFDARVVRQVVSCEALNNTDDFLFWDVDRGRPNPINACLNAGWRVGLLGVSDEHGSSYGLPGKARGGLWVTELTRRGVREAMAARRFFASQVDGLRLDASAGGVQMGGTVALPGGRGDVEIALDLDRGPAWHGKTLNVQVYRPGSAEITLAHAADVVLAPDTLHRLTVPIDVADGAWAFLRVTDPAEPGDARAPQAIRSLGRAVAYASPWWFAAA